MKLPALQTQPKQYWKQQQKGREALLQDQHIQQQPQQQEQGQSLAAPTAMSLAGHCDAALGSHAQQAGLDPGKGISAEAGQDMPFSRQSHVSASRSTSKSDKQATSQQQYHTLTIAESAAQSSYDTEASWGRSGSKPETHQPLLHESINPAETAAMACHQGLREAALMTAEQQRKTRHQVTSSGALQAALEPAGPVTGAQSAGQNLPASIDKSEQLPSQLAKHGVHVSKSRGQKRKSTHDAPATKGLGHRTRQQDTGGRAAVQNPRNASCEASAAPAESQQSAVHALLAAPAHHGMPVKQPALKRSMPAATGQTPFDNRTTTSKAKQSRTEMTVGLAVVKDVEQTRKHGQADWGTMPPSSNISQLGDHATRVVGTRSPQMLSINVSPLKCGDGGLCEGAEAEGSPGAQAHAPLQGRNVSTQSSSMDHQPKGCDRLGQPGKRPLRKRDTDGNKPWWVV